MSASRIAAPIVDRHLLRANAILQTFSVQVWQPAGLESGRRYPVLYATDGNLTFDVLKGIAHNLTFSEPLVEKFILVAIGYPSSAPWAGALLRGRDLMFPGFPLADRTPPPWEGLELFEPESKSFHGAFEFQRFLTDQLLPFIDANYPTNTDRRLYFGHSGGASFGLGTLFTRPNLFAGYILSSPATYISGTSSAGVVHTDDGFLFDYAQRFLAERHSLAPTSLFLSIGGEEEYSSELRHYHLTSSFIRMVALLKGASLPNLHIAARLFEGEHHMTVWPFAFSHGLRALLALPPSNAVA